MIAQLFFQIDWPIVARVAAIAIFMNWQIRGGGWKSTVPAIKDNFPKIYRFLHLAAIDGKDLRGDDWINGAVYGVVFAHIAAPGHPIYVAGGVGLWAGLCMVAGATPGWGRYIEAMRGQHPTRSRAWGLWRMTLRGGFWGLCLSLAGVLPFFWIHTPNFAPYALACILGGLAQGPIYYGAIRFFERWPALANRVVNAWTSGEILHAPCLWLPVLAFLVK